MFGIEDSFLPQRRFQNIGKSSWSVLEIPLLAESRPVQLQHYPATIPVWLRIEVEGRPEQLIKFDVQQFLAISDQFCDKGQVIGDHACALDDAARAEKAERPAVDAVEREQRPA